MERIICIVFGYIFGLFETGYIYGKFKNMDIREHGSGNAGSTNALRTFGKVGGLITLLGDVLKAVIPCVAVFYIFQGQGVEYAKLLQMYVGVGVILGHVFPFYLGFKGGKGIASTGGFLLVVNLPGAGIAFAVFLLLALTTKYVSLGSVVGLTVAFICQVVFGQMGMLGISGSYLIENYVLMALVAILGIVKHKENIKRLLNGTENKLSFGSKKEA